MHFEFTARSKNVIALARDEAIALQHPYVGTEHILLGLIRESEGVAVAALLDLRVDLDQVRQRINESVRLGSAPVTLDTLPYTSRAKKALDYAIAEARDLQHTYVGTEHLLLGLLREDRAIAAQVLQSLGVTYDAIRSKTRELLGSPAEPVFRTLTGSEVPLMRVVRSESAKYEMTLVRCSFCGRDYNHVRALVSGPGVYICDSCVQEATRIIADAADTEPGTNDA